MPLFIIFIILLVVLGLIFIDWRIRKTNIEHIQKLEQLKKTVVELSEKQLLLNEKVALANELQKSNNRSFEKLNTEASGLFQLLMKMAETKEKQNGKT